MLKPGNGSRFVPRNNWKHQDRNHQHRNGRDDPDHRAGRFSGRHHHNSKAWISVLVSVLRFLVCGRFLVLGAWGFSCIVVYALQFIHLRLCYHNQDVRSLLCCCIIGEKFPIFRALRIVKIRFHGLYRSCHF